MPASQEMLGLALVLEGVNIPGEKENRLTSERRVRVQVHGSLGIVYRIVM